MGNIRVRMVEYTPGYLADHWCNRGHIANMNLIFGCFEDIIFGCEHVKKTKVQKQGILEVNNCLPWIWET